jgi:carboxylate-amine ligase
MPLPPFHESEAYSLGVELELQILSPHDFDLTGGAPDLIDALSRRTHPGEIKPEITQSMVEVSTSVHGRLETLMNELQAIRRQLVETADRLNLIVAGGGAHPFQHWNASCTVIW